MIHPGAIVDEGAVIGSNVSIGPWTLVGPGVSIGDDCVIGPHCTLTGPTVIGRGNRIHAYCSIGEACQDKKFEGDTVGRLVIGDNNTFREYCSVNRGTPGGGGVTTVGDGNWVMAYCHIAHDCHVGNHTVFANNATLAGHVTIDDHVILGGFTGVHQFCRIGSYSFTAISAIVVKDVPPYLIVSGNTARARGLNRVGLRRHGFEPEAIDALKRAYRIFFRSSLTRADAVAELENMAAGSDEIRRMLEFIRASGRGVVR